MTGRAFRRRAVSDISASPPGIHRSKLSNIIQNFLQQKLERGNLVFRKAGAKTFFGLQPDCFYCLPERRVGFSQKNVPDSSVRHPCLGSNETFGRQVPQEAQGGGGARRPDFFQCLYGKSFYSCPLNPK